MAAPLSDDDDLYWLPFDKVLGLLQLTTVLYYLHETNPDNGLVRDKTDPKAPVSIAAVGMALATIPVVVERGVINREFAAKITLKRLRYLLACPQGPEPDATGYKGFFYHFLDIETGRRVWQCELSTIDSAFLFAGALTVATYFDRDTADEAEILSIAVAASHRGRGLSRNLLLTHLGHLAGRGVRTVFLEVEENNQPARRLYQGAGFAIAGRRERYYPEASGEQLNALVMRRDLS